MSIRPIPTNSPAKPLSRSLSSCLALCCALLQKSKAHPLAFQSLPCSLQKHGGCYQKSSFDSSTLNSSTFSLATPLDATLTADLRVLPCFRRNRPPTSLLESTLTDIASVTPLSATLTKNAGGGGWRAN